jgi:Ca2+-binding RTX toxin-like protein
MNITTGSSNDTVIRPVFVNGSVFRSNDIIQTGAGNDIINAGLGIDDYVDGGEGIDRLIVDYSVADTGGGMYFNSTSGTAGTAYRSSGIPNTRNLDYTYFKNVEQFTIIGTSKDDTIKTYYGSNVINAGAGNDTVLALAGNLDGGSGFDDLTLNLSAQTANLNLSNLSNINISGVVTAINFEQFTITTGNGNDIVTQANVLNGVILRANDVIKTGAGNDTINAGLGKDDTVDGGGGVDRLILDYSAGDTGTGMYFNAGSVSGSAYRSLSSTNSTRLDSIFFSNIEQFTIVGSSQDDSITTNAGNDIINAGAGNDTIVGGAGGDILTGGFGIDTFKYQYQTDSLLGNHDVIKDFAIGTDVIDGPRAIAAAFVKKLGNVIALTEAAIQQILTPTTFESNGASTFKFGDRTFLGLNDATAGFSARTDSVIDITGYTGNLSNLKIM